MGKYEIGNIFGDFKIIQRVDTGKKYNYVYECQCVNCGYVENRSITLLYNNKNLCKKCNDNFGKTTTPLKDYSEIINKVIDQLTIKKYIGKKDGSHAFFDCECSCGKHCIKNITYLNNSKIKHMCPDCSKIKSLLEFSHSKNNIGFDINKLKKLGRGDEKFLPIIGSDNYLIGNYGDVAKNRNGQLYILTPWLDSKGKYYYVNLSYNKKQC